ncbi:class II aldolase/adducin family protein [Microbacterium rhizophilus]|uniref:class II aldolase/adducin family protein n=1 Tax=Microbacterium rhizophilus TaxID=3138934 RepID=UPI0031EC4152
MDLAEIKIQLAHAIRMLVRAELLDMNGHLSYRIPGTDELLINSRKASRATLTADNIVRIDLDGELREGEGEPPSEFHIHTSVYRARPDVASVLHHHPHWQTVLGIARQPMQPVFSIGSFVSPELPVYETSSLVNTREIGDELATCLGEHSVATIRHHGAIVVGEGIQEVFARAIFVEENAKKQYYASLLGPIQPLEGENLERTRETNWKPIIAAKIWNYYAAQGE